MFPKIMHPIEAHTQAPSDYSTIEIWKNHCYFGKTNSQLCVRNIIYRNMTVMFHTNIFLKNRSLLNMYRKEPKKI